jgi:hypothetical protein
MFKPIKLDFGGIDPAIFFDDNKGYIVHMMLQIKERT